jgi:Zonular occludens toxin (Zot)
VSIHFISGKPGAGKSLYATKLVFEELRFGNRQIVTNLALKPGELNAYYHRHYGDASGIRRFRVPRFLNFLFWILPDWLIFKVFPVSLQQMEERTKSPQVDDICSRITLITDEDLPTFFTKRPGIKIDSISNEDWRMGMRPDYTVVKDHGVFFVLDEVHIAFNSRAWALTGAEVLYYLSQHRKLGDDVLCITQSVANVDKQFRSVAQDFTYIRNLGKESFGHFRLPMRFIRKTYAQPPVGDKSEPMEMGSFALDVNGLATCYDTAKGVGIHGRAGADTKHRKKGIHWLWFVVGLPVLLFGGMHYIPPLIAKHLSHAPALPAHTAIAQSLETNSATLQDGHLDGPVQQNPRSDFLPSRYMRTNEEVYCVGWVKYGTEYLAFTSDGNTYSSADSELDFIRKREISILGKIYKIKLRPAASEFESQPQHEFSGVVIPRAEPYVEVIPFGSRNQPSPLPINGLAHQSNPYFGSHTANQPPTSTALTSQNDDTSN